VIEERKRTFLRWVPDTNFHEKDNLNTGIDSIHKFVSYVCLCTLIGSVLLLASCASMKKVKAVSAESLMDVSSSFPTAETCGHCHVEIYNEWKTSPHAMAYISKGFREATANYRFEDCLGCHAPEPQYSAKRPSRREYLPEEGVTCVSCHLEEGKISGPVESTALVIPHPVAVRTDRYRSSQMCGRCHEGTYREWTQANVKNKPTCQECHMPSIERKITQSTDVPSKVLVSFEDKVPQKQHVFRPVPTELKTPPYHAELVRSATGIAILFHNHIPHSLPTGDFGMRVVSLEAYMKDTLGKIKLIGSKELTRKLKTAIPAGKTLRWNQPESNLKPGPLEIRLVRHATRSQPQVDFYKQGFTLR